MADTTTTTSKKTTAAAEAPVVDKNADLTFPVDRFVSESIQFFGPDYPAHVVAGGLAGVKDELSISDAKDRINKWLQTEIKE